VEAAHARRSIAVSSNRHPSDFDTLMPKPLATVAPLFHAQVVLTDDGSPRLAEATAGTGVMPLA
jgi:hypothetical protein